jgi:hypothetical protein
VVPPSLAERVAAASDAERRFVLALGGFALELSGATLVTHEKLPVPRFNFVDAREIAPGRQAGVLERALDHYFQRALRPTFRLPDPAPAHLDRALRALSFRPRPSPLTLLLEADPLPVRAPPRFQVAAPRGIGSEDLAGFWATERERPEFRAALDIALHHPNPNEQLVPVVASDAGVPVTAALAFRYRQSAGIHLVATQPPARGRGAASELVAFVLHERPFSEAVDLSMLSDDARVVGRLTKLGLAPAHTWVEYELPRDAELSGVPRPAPGPPLWRPPRGP